MSKKYTPKLEMRALDAIFPYEKNAKIHTEEQIAALAEVIKTQGWDVPIVVDADGVVIKGHGRRLAAIGLGLKEVPVIVRSDLSPAQVKAARLSDNRVALGDVDTELLREELRNIAGSEDLDMSAIGFSEKEIEMMLGDIEQMDDSAFEDGDVDAPKATGPKETTDAAPAGAKGAKPDGRSIADVLGFKILPTSYERFVGKFIAFAEAETGTTGAEAFGLFCQSVVTEHEARA
jgi:ParB-like chromosome segregation protein Spo0J